MAKRNDHRFVSAFAFGLLGLTLAGCGPRVVVSTGTTLGLKATPGDGNTRPPQVTFGYKRAETALVPTAGGKATSTTDAFSTLAVIYFSTQWFGPTELQSFVGTGIAARDVQQPPDEPEQPAPQGIPGVGEPRQSEFWEEFSRAAPSKR